MRYPLDFETLHKGDILSRDYLEQVLAKAEEGDFGLQVLDLIHRIEVCGFTCRTQDESKTGRLAALRILSDSEAARYNPLRCEQHMAGFGRRLKLAAQVLTTNLTEQERRDFEAQLIHKSRIYQAIQQTRQRSFQLNPAQPTRALEKGQ